MSSISEKLPTKERILEVAERLFAERGLDGTSMRDITDAAGVNLASVNYHFGSKDGLIAAVFDRHLTPLNEARMAMLDAVEAAAGDGTPALEPVLEAFIRPAVVCVLAPLGEGAPFLRLMGRCLNEPPTYAEKHVYPHFEKLIARLNTAVARAVPELTREEVFWRMAFLAGALHYALQAWSTSNLPLKPRTPMDPEELVRQLIAFGVAGLRSGAPLRDGGDLGRSGVLADGRTD